MDEPTAALDRSRRAPAVRHRAAPEGARRRHRLHQPSHGRDFRRSPTASRCCATAPMSARATSPQTTSGELVQMMVGRKIESLFPKIDAPIGAPVLEARDLVRQADDARRQPDRARRRNRRACRPRRLGPQRAGADAVRHHARRVRRNPHRRRGGRRSARPARRARSASPMCRRIAAPGARAADERVAQFLARRA